MKIQYTRATFFSSFVLKIPVCDAILLSSPKCNFHSAPTQGDTMNYFFADDHYDVNPGRHIFELLPEDFRKETVFTENDWSGQTAWNGGRHSLYCRGYAS